MSLTGVTVLLVLEPAAAAEATRRGVRQRVAAAGGRCSINGTPPLAAYELSHIVSDGWDTLRRRAPSLARRHAGSDGPPPKRQRVVTPSLPPQQQQQQQLTQGSDICHLVTQAWLTTTLLAGEPQPESEFVLPLCAGAGVDTASSSGGPAAADGSAVVVAVAPVEGAQAAAAAAAAASGGAGAGGAGGVNPTGGYFAPGLGRAAAAAGSSGSGSPPSSQHGQASHVDCHREYSGDGQSHGWAGHSEDQDEQEEPEDLTAVLLDHLDSLAKLVEAHDPRTGGFRKRAYILAINCIKRYRKAGHILSARSDFIALCEQPNSLLGPVGKKTREKCAEFLSTRTTRRAAGYESDPRISVEELFKRIWGAF